MPLTAGRKVVSDNQPKYGAQVFMARAIFLFCAMAVAVSPSQSLSQTSDDSILTETLVELDEDSGDGPELAAGNLTTVQIENLALLAKIWGFLKYHHPRVVSGKLDWDKELLRIIPELLRAQESAARNRTILAWATNIGIPKQCDLCAMPAENAHLQPRLDWIYDEMELGSPLSSYLDTVHQNRQIDGGQHYISKYGAPTYGTLTNEPDYADLPSIDANLRLLALFRYWNVIEYWFPYYDVIGSSWDSVLREFIPRFMVAESRHEYSLELRSVIARVHDSHASLWNGTNYPPLGDCALPISARFIEGQAVVTAYTNDVAGPNSGVNIGDVVKSIDGKQLEGLIADWRPFFSASNDASLYRLIGTRMARGPCGMATLVVQRSHGTTQVKIERISRDDISFENVVSHDLFGDPFQILGNDVAYLKLSALKASDVAGYIEAAQKMKGLIVDLRNYPLEFVVFELGQRLIQDPTPFALFTRRDLNNPGAFVWPEVGSILHPSEPNYGGVVVVLVDELTQSQAEYTAMALRSGPTAIVIGSTTAGADGDIVYIPLPGGMRTAISGAGVFYPDKSPTQRIGITPDLFVSPTVAGVRQGRDEVLERALVEIVGTEID